MNSKVSQAIEKLINEILGKKLIDRKEILETERYNILLENNALPIYGDMGGCIGIRPDGKFLSYCWNDEVTEQTDEAWQLIALIYGKEKYPILNELLPEQDDKAIVCPRCHGTKIDRVGDQIPCRDCFGLGWVNDYIVNLRETFRMAFTDKEESAYLM